MSEIPDQLIEKLDLEPHPEGGYYRRTYEADLEVEESTLPDNFGGDRSVGSAILYLLPGDEVSRLHRLQADEMWHFYWGSPLTIHVIDPEGHYERRKLGPNLENNERPQQLIPGGHWFGATVDGEFSLAGCTVWPEFDFEDYTLGDRDELVTEYPEHEEIITRLT